MLLKGALSDLTDVGSMSRAKLRHDELLDDDELAYTFIQSVFFSLLFVINQFGLLLVEEIIQLSLTFQCD